MYFMNGVRLYMDNHAAQMVGFETSRAQSKYGLGGCFSSLFLSLYLSISSSCVCVCLPNLVLFCLHYTYLFFYKLFTLYVSWNAYGTYIIIFPLFACLCLYIGIIHDTGFVKPTFFVFFLMILPYACSHASK